MEIWQKNIFELSKMLRNKEISAVELTQFYLKRIKEKQPLLKSFITISGNTALRMAKRADDKLHKEMPKQIQQQYSSIYELKIVRP